METRSFFCFLVIALTLIYSSALGQQQSYDPSYTRQMDVARKLQRDIETLLAPFREAGVVFEITAKCRKATSIEPEPANIPDVNELVHKGDYFSLVDIFSSYCVNDEGSHVQYDIKGFYEAKCDGKSFLCSVASQMKINRNNDATYSISCAGEEIGICHNYPSYTQGTN